MSGTTTVKKVVAQPVFAMICILFQYFIFPRYGGIAIMVGNASVLSLLVLGLPESFRSRRGSLTPAICLVAAMWLGAAVTTALTLMGEVR